MPTEPSSIKFPKPRILLVDMPRPCEVVLRDSGYNVSTGTFGIPLGVPPSDDLVWVSTDTCSLPEHEEQEIVIANTRCRKAKDVPPFNGPGIGVDNWWQRSSKGAIDPRPFYMNSVNVAFERILQHGGIFVIQLAARYSVEYSLGSSRPSGSVDIRGDVNYTNWSLLSVVEALGTMPCTGTEIAFDSCRDPLVILLKKGANGARYSCVVTPEQYAEYQWTPLATNKYGKTVAALIKVGHEPTGYILLLPEVPQLHTILVRLIEEQFSQWCPRLFPFHEGLRWLHRPDYELPEVNERLKSIENVNLEAQQRVHELNEEITAIREANQDWYTLLNGTGNKLVGAVIRALRNLGFTHVVDVDEQERAAGNQRGLREDIQVRDADEILIIDVKGIIGCPEDSDATQSEKHALMRAKEFGGRVKPLTIINHQRNLAPHVRQVEPYRKEIVANAVQTKLGLMTTWDLFRLLRNKQALNWPDDVVRAIFYRTGRIYPVPEHYVEIGEIVRVWKHSFGIVPNQAVALNARLAIETGDLLEVITVDSLQVHEKDVTIGPVKSDCGVSCPDASKRFKKGMRVFLIHDSTRTA